MYPVQEQPDEILDRIMDEYEWAMTRNSAKWLQYQPTIPSILMMQVLFPDLEVEESSRIVLHYCHKYKIFFKNGEEYLHYYVKEIW